ncbi:hypothetical protein KQX54_018250 [Cotesia glomerata]|uniref:Uncharacterized protein n=1 Tax=Cotesia glomerata TaxID=32391 RepID=A0AAV7IND0_COTGL|nr:hypothetical protein KQX54_018250 [Cotesia glomerata]
MAVRNDRARTYQRYLEELHIPQDHFRLEDDCVRCLLCTTALKSLKLYTFERHLRTNKHQDAINLRNQPVFPAPQHLPNLNSRHSPFFKDLAAGVSINVWLDEIKFFRTEDPGKIFYEISSNFMWNMV